MDKRTTLALILSFMVIMLYQVFLSIYYPPVEEESPATSQMTTHGETPTAVASKGSPPPVSVIQPETGPNPTTMPPAKKMLGKTLAFTSPLVEGKVSTLGGRLSTLNFIKFKDHLGEDGKPFAFFNEHVEQIFYGESGFISLPGVIMPTRETLWQAAEFTGKPGESGIRLTWDNGAGLLFEKLFVFPADSYLVSVIDRVSNQTGQPVPLYRYQQLVRIPPVHTDENMYDFQGPTAFLDDVRLQMSYDDIKAKEFSQQAHKGWAGFSDKYFLAAIIPDGAGKISQKFYFDYDAPTHRIGTVSQQQFVTANSQFEVRDSWYIGPKALKTLESMNLGLERSIDYGWFHFLAVPLMETLFFFNGLFGNFAIAIVILTMVIKLLFYPLADKSYRSMDAMKKLQPKVEALRQTYGHDKQLLNQEIMRLYQEHKVNPLGGCLPMLIQIPVFFALYKVLFLSIEMRHAPLGGWIHDLSAQDPFYILPLLMGASMYFQGKLNPTPADPIQAKVMSFLPVIFTVMFLTFPSGLVMYWLVNNILSIAQQLAITKSKK